MKILRLSLILLLTKLLTAKNDEQRRGPYKSILISIRRCQNSTYPLKKDPPIQMNLWLTSSGASKFRMMSGNLTVLKETKQVRLKIKSFSWANGKWKLTSLMNGITCHGMLLDVLSRTIGIKVVDQSKCAYMQGTYSFNSLNIDKIHHIFATKMEYGQTLWRSEMNVGFSTYHCFEYFTVIERV